MIKKGRYRHYKGKEYEVLGTALHSETMEEMVIYKPLYKSISDCWVRPAKMFLEDVEIEGQCVSRFTFIE